MSGNIFRRNKYGAKRADGFPSLLEREVYQILVRREESGEIREIKRQTVVVLKDCKECGDRVTWKIDFSFVDCKSDQLTYCEAKGVETNDYKKKLKLFKKNAPAPLEIYKGSWQRPKLVERIEKAS